MFRRLPDDPELDDIDPMMKLWMYESWLRDEEEKHKFAKDYAIFSGSFHNPEAAKKLMQEENPDVSLNEEEEQQSIDMVLAAGDAEEQAERDIVSKHRRIRRRAMKVINKE